MDPQLKQLMKELGDAINQSLRESALIKEVVDRLKEAGYDIYMVLEAKVGVRKHGTGTKDLSTPEPRKDTFRESVSDQIKQLVKKPMDPLLKQLLNEFGDAMNQSLSDSEQISEVVSRMKEGGYGDFYLALEATIGVNNGTKDKLVVTTRLGK